MRATITAQVIGQTLMVTNAPKLASGGENVFQVELTLDSSWTGYGLEAVFWRDKKRQFRVVLVDGIGIIPWEVTAEPGEVHFSVRGVSGNTVRSTEAVVLNFVLGSPAARSYPVPLPDVYKQVLSAQGRNAQAIAAERARIDAQLVGGTTDGELIDVRVGADGGTYTTAGTAVRQQLGRKLDVDGENQISAFNVDFFEPNGAVDYFRDKVPYRADSNFSATGFWEDAEHDVYRISVEPETTYIMGRTLAGGLDGLLVPKLMYSAVSNFDAGMPDSVIGSVASVAYGASFTTPVGCSYIYAMLKKTQVGQEAPVLQKGTQLLPLLTGYRLTENVVNVKHTDYAAQKWVAIGDSLTDANTLTGEDATDNYVDMVASALNVAAENHGASGTGYQNAYAEGKAFYQRALSIPSDVDVVTIFGSGNDSDFAQKYVANHEGSVGSWDDAWNDNWLDTDPNLFDTEDISYCAVVNHTLDNILSVAPFARIGIISMTPWKDQQNDAAYTPIMRKMTDALKDICEHRGIPFLDLYRCSQMRPDDPAFRAAMYLNGDGVHPTSEGHQKYIYPQVREFLARLL